MYYTPNINIMNAITDFKSIAPNNDTELHFQEQLETFPCQLVKKGTYILQEGAIPKDIVYIEKGRIISLAKYNKEEKELAIGYFHKEQFINLSALTNRQKNKQSAKALSPATIRRIPIYKFNGWMRKNPYIHQLVLHSLVRELERKKQAYYQNIVLKSEERVIHFLLDQIQQVGIRVGYEWVIRDFFTQKEIALLTNTARQTVNLVLNSLRKKKIVHFTYKYFIVRELAALEAMVNTQLIKN